MSIFSERLYQARLTKGFTQAQIAERIPMTQPSYSRIENGFQEPNLIQLKRIAEELEVSLDYLLDAHTQFFNNQRNYEVCEQIKFIYNKYFKDSQDENYIDPLSYDYLDENQEKDAYIANDVYVDDKKTNKSK